MKKYFFCIAACTALSSAPVMAEDTLLAMNDPEFDAILARDIAELTVTSVSKRPQQRSDTAAAIYVITQEDIQRIGATSVPEALRVVPGLEVARASSHRWAVTARGSNNVIASKLLVLIDGRSIYTPVFSGTYWDDQTPLLKDIDRIEVIRGPGGSLYGANAVNGIINIITKHTSETEGDYISVGLGNEEKLLAGRHGGKIGNDAFYRSYAQLHDYDSTARYQAGNNHDDWKQARAGFRYDKTAENNDEYTLQGDVYASRYDTEMLKFRGTAPFAFIERGGKSSHGANILGRWGHELEDGSNLSLQTYVDYYHRGELHFDQRVATADAHFQHNITLNDRNIFVWGGGVRSNLQRLDSTFTAGVSDESVSRTVYDLFVQDEYALIPETLYGTVGSKFEHNPYTGFEVQPSARLSWKPTEHQTVWGAVSRAIRTPSEIEDQAFSTLAVLPGAPPTSFAIVGSDDLKSEELLAFELGYRTQPLTNLSFDITGFYNDYDNLGAIGPFGATPFMRLGALVTPLPFVSLGSGQTYGIEISTDWNVNDDWRLSGSYSYLQMDLDYSPPALALVFDENASPQHKFSIQSYYNFSDTVKWDNMVYYVDGIQLPADAYLRYDTRLAWQATPSLELSLIGRNLLDNRHVEFTYYPQAEIERSVMGMATWNF